MARKRVAPSRQEIAQAKLLYDADVAPVGEVMRLLGMNASQFRTFREMHGWPLRPSPIKRGAKIDKIERAPSRSLIARLEDAVEREFAHAEEALAKGGSKTIEASARILASLVRSLGELKRMSRDASPAAADAREDDERASDERLLDAPPRELAELRAELARRLERLRGEGEIG